jgi:hypothetical protein
MRPLAVLIFVACLAFYSCKLDHLNPDDTNHSTTKIPMFDPASHLPIAGVWTWNAEYDGGPNGFSLLNPDNSGITETLTLATDSTWSQTLNGKIVNSGTYHLVYVIPPSGYNMAFKLINKTQPTDAQFTDDFDFGRGFVDSYVCTGDSLILSGVVNTSPSVSYEALRIYVK